MSNYGDNAYAGKNLANQTSSAFTNALGQTGDIFSTGMDIMSRANGPSTVAKSDLDSYMNPFARNVINPTMAEFDRQHQLGQKGVDDAAFKAKAFGGDRFGIQSAALDRDYMTQKGSFLANFNKGNFDNAQTMAQNDVNNRLNTGTLGSTLMQGGAEGIGRLANMGFGFGDSLQRNNLQAGALKQSLVQSIIDAAKGQYAGQTGSPASGLEALLKSITAASPGGAGTTTQTQNPGILGTISGIGSTVAPFLK